jgi:endogenous inhibitor of DNA gyrase (YacG/DUF329 family)
VTDHYGIYAHEHATLAYKVSDEWGDNGSLIVWARNPMEAKRVGSNRLDLEYDCVECERFPKLDGFVGDLLGWLIDDGWYFPCHHCGSRYGDPGCESGYVRAGVDNDTVFCSEKCRDAHFTKWAERARVEREFQRFAEVKYFGLDVKVSYVNVAGDAHVQARVHGTSRYEYGGFIARSELDRSVVTSSE